MRSATLVTTLTGVTTVMAVAAPLVVFGFLYVLQVQPERAREREAQNELHAALADRERRRAAVAAPRVTAEGAAVDAFLARVARGERADELGDALTALLLSPAVGGVSNLILRTDAAGAERARMTMTFDAKYEQIVRLLRCLRALPAFAELEAVEIGSNTSSSAPVTHARVSLLVAQKQAAPQATSGRVPASGVASTGQTRSQATGQRPGPAPEPDPVVTSILVSSGRRVALVEGQIVAPGDRLAIGVVQSIEPDAVVFTGPDGRSRRVEIARPGIEFQRR